MNFNVIKSLLMLGATAVAGVAITSVVAYKSKRMGMQEMFINTVEGALNAMPHDGKVVKFDNFLMLVVDGDTVMTVDIDGDTITVTDEKGLITMHTIDEAELVNNVVYDLTHNSEYFHIPTCDCAACGGYDDVDGDSCVCDECGVIHDDNEYYTNSDNESPKDTKSDKKK